MATTLVVETLDNKDIVYYLSCKWKNSISPLRTSGVSNAYATTKTFFYTVHRYSSPIRAHVLQQSCPVRYRRCNRFVIYFISSARLIYYDTRETCANDRGGKLTATCTSHKYFFPCQCMYALIYYLETIRRYDQPTGAFPVS